MSLFTLKASACRARSGRGEARAGPAPPPATRGMVALRVARGYIHVRGSEFLK